MRKYSFFDGSHFPTPDIMQFVKSFIDGDSLHVMAYNSGMDHKTAPWTGPAFVEKSRLSMS